MANISLVIMTSILAKKSAIPLAVSCLEAWHKGYEQGETPKKDEGETPLYILNY